MNKEQQEAALKLANRFLDPEDLGLASDPLTRDLARMTIGLKPVECVFAQKPRLRKSGWWWQCGADMIWWSGITPEEAYNRWAGKQ